MSQNRSADLGSPLSIHCEVKGKADRRSALLLRRTFLIVLVGETRADEEKKNMTLTPNRNVSDSVDK